tara:strand:+ start:367 stop:1005 length:639 start_codon:yes stop_codon:yes gene_type:complete
MSFFEPDNKRRRLLDSINLTDTSLGQTDDDVEKTTPMKYDEIMDVQYKKCFICENVHAAAIQKNETYAYMMSLYTKNAANICKDSIYQQIYDYFQEYIVAEIKEMRKEMEEQGDVEGLAETPIPEWSLEGVKEHFEYHTNYPTDELIFQVRLHKALRRNMMNSLLEKKDDGTVKINHKTIDTLQKLEKSIIDIMKAKKDINTMAGYSPELDY